ncbi:MULTISPECIES: FG-GAP repeat domain-containing protein [Streptomyces]|uniref:VCBS repeat-containing protein n=1 Tax=Streptomyces sudanensis TaxID=436397 RepID=A0ABY4TIH5_9ACTN|nr:MULTISPECIES: VCBS repeat-containing protein [Streptomyces]URN16780.1 VCBS repeat-containing protein [Streptomyces sudanensis]
MQFHSTRLAMAVTAVLAVTALGAGTLATAPAAFAAGSESVSGPAAAGQSAALPVFPTGSDLAGAGATGFLSYSFTQSGATNLLWTPYDGGAPTRFRKPENGGWSMAGGDVLVLGDANWTIKMRSLTLLNMADPSAPGVAIDLGALNGNYLAVLSPTSVLAQVTKDDGTAELHIVSKDGATTTSREVSGLPADATDFFSSGVQDGVALVGYETGPAGARTGGRALVDVTTGTVVETYASAESGYDLGSLMFSGSHVAWLEYEIGTGLFVTSVDRRTLERKRTFVGSRAEENYGGLVGGWLMYGNASTPLRAVSLTSGETRDLVDRVTGSAAAGDGSVLVSGGRAADGEGLFRIAAAADGTLTVTKVAEAGEPAGQAELSIEEVHVPDTVNLDTTGGKVTLGWTLSHRDAHLDVTLTHTATGKEFRTRVNAPATGTRFSFTWDGTIDGVDAPNGPYGVEAEARFLDGSGEPAYQGWLMKVVRAVNPHDYTNNGSTDLLARDAAGVLWRDDLRDRSADGRIESARRTQVGRGWQTYKQIEAVGDIAGNEVGDLVALDGSGVLWHYLGKGDGTFAARERVGSGWGVYNKLTGGSDLDGDGRADLLAVDTAGVLWFYKGTSIPSAPFAARVRIGSGWNAFTQLVGAGDVDNDGRPDMIAYGTGGTYLYRSTGSVTAPFTRWSTSLYAGEGSKFNNVV